MFHDSNSADPLPIPTPDNGIGSGGGAGAPIVTPPENPKVTRINVRTPSANAWSYEGQKPNLSGTSIELWWDDGGVTLVSGGTGLATIPAILGEEQAEPYVASGSANGNIISSTDITGIGGTTIKVFHPSAPSVFGEVTLPAVVPLLTDQPGTAGTGLMVTGRLATVYEDGEEPDLSTAGVVGFYYGVERWPIPNSTNFINAVTPNVAGANQASVVVSPGAIRAINLDGDYITPVLLKGTSPNQYRYAYSIDPTDTEYVDGRAATMTITVSPGKSDTTAKKIKLPVTNYRYVRRVELAEELTWSQDYWFDDQDPTGVNWGNVLVNSGIALNVYYHGVPDDDYNPRGASHVRRAIQLGFADVTAPNFAMLDQEGPEAVFVRLGYYGYYPTTTPNSSGGNYANTVLDLQVPLATFREEIIIVRRPNTAGPDPDYPLQVTGGRSFDGTAQTALIATIKATYQIFGLYTFGTGDPVRREVTSSGPDLWQTSWFTAGFREITGYNELVPGVVEVPITINTVLPAGWSTAYRGTETAINVYVIPQR